MGSVCECVCMYEYVRLVTHKEDVKKDGIRKGGRRKKGLWLTSQEGRKGGGGTGQTGRGQGIRGRGRCRRQRRGVWTGDVDWDQEKV